MEQFIIDQTSRSPRIELSQQGDIKISGRLSSEDPIEVFNPIINWIEKNNLSRVNIEIALEYINTIGVKHIFDIYQFLEENFRIKHVNTDWYYEVGDDSILELGKDIASMFSFPFNFREFEKKENP